VSFEIARTYRFEAAHWLPAVPAAHRCRNLHGHSYVVEAVIGGNVEQKAGWIVDFATIDEALGPVIELLDHRCLNEVEGLENPTSELLARWIWERLEPQLPGLALITVKETPDSRASYRRG
jgi:6-pyruvoyltetrahydropterin/6-carboxytetrahydropterin synthase